MRELENTFNHEDPIYTDDEFRARLYDTVAKTGQTYRKRGGQLILFSFPVVVAGFFLKSVSVTGISFLGTALILLAGMFLFLGFMIRMASPARSGISFIEFILDRAEFRHVHFIPGKGGHRLHGLIHKRYIISPDGSLEENEQRSGKDRVPDFFVPEDVFRAVSDRGQQNDSILLVELNGDIIGSIWEKNLLVSAGVEIRIPV